MSPEQRLLDAIGTEQRPTQRPRPFPSPAAPALPPLADVSTRSGLASPTDLGRIVRDARRKMGISQQRFADLAGVGRRFISELEAGKPTLEFGRVLSVCRAVGIDLIAQPR